MISTEIYDFERSRNNGYTIYIIILGVVITPVLEEIAFRLPLKRFDFKSIILAIAVVLGLFFMYYFPEYLWWPKGKLFFFLTHMFYLISIIGILFALLNQFGVRISKLKNFWNNNPSKIYYLSLTLFTVLHVFNLNIEIKDLVFLPIALLPFLISGLAFGYLRVRLGLIYSILMHIIINGLSFTFG